VLSDGNISANEKREDRHSFRRMLPRLRKATEISGLTAVCFYFLICTLPLETDFALILLACATIPNAVFARSPGPAGSSRMDLAIILFLGVQAVAIFFSPDFRTSLALSAPLLPAILVYYLISAQVRNISSLRPVCLTISVVALALATAVLWTAGRFPWASAKAWVTQVGSPMIVVPNDFTFHALVMPLSALFLVRTRSTVVRIVAGMSITLSLAAITLLRSRASLLTAFVSLALFAALKRPRLVFISIAGLLVIFVATDAVFSFALLGKFGQLGDEGVTGRASLWSVAWAAFLGSPWTGQGPHTFVFEKVRWVHNLYLEALAEQGLAGLLGLVILLGYGLWCAWRAHCLGSVEMADIGGATFAALVGFCFAALFELTFLRQWVPLVLFTLLGVAARLRAAGTKSATLPA